MAEELPPVPQVVELLEGWAFDEGYEVTTGTRKFIDASSLPQQTAIDLPIIGSPFDEDWPLVTLKSIRVRRLANRPNCPMVYECNYDSKQFSADLWLSTPAAIVSTNIGGDYTTYTNPMVSPGTDTKWKWDDGSNAPDIIIPQFEYTNVVRLSRYLYPGGDLTAWQIATGKLVNCINNDTFLGYAKGLLLYTGADLAPMASAESNSKMWKAELTFKARGVFQPGSVPPRQVLDWNYIFDPITITYRKLLLDGVANKTLYAYDDFKPLISSCRPLPRAIPISIPIRRLAPARPPAPATP